MLISDDYRKQNKELFARYPDYGSYGHRFIGPAIDLINQSQARSILDYGCGQGTLGKALREQLAKSGQLHRVKINEYDPAIEGKDGPATPSHVVICNDVLEHIEPDCLDDVLADLGRVTERVGLLVVATRPAKKTLADGRNAHLIQRPWWWWAEQISRHLTVRLMTNLTGEAHFLVEPKGASNAEFVPISGD